MLEALNRATSKNAALAAELREKQVRIEIATQLLERSVDDANIILLVLGNVGAADSIVAGRITADKVEEIRKQTYDTWEKFIVTRALARTNREPADEVEDDIPYGKEESTDED